MKENTYKHMTSRFLPGICLKCNPNPYIDNTVIEVFSFFIHDALFRYHLLSKFPMLYPYRYSVPIGLYILFGYVKGKLHRMPGMCVLLWLGLDAT